MQVDVTELDGQRTILHHFIQPFSELETAMAAPAATPKIQAGVDALHFPYR